MQLVKRKSCSVSNKKDLEKLHTVSNFPIFMGCVNSDRNADITADMIWTISKSSGLIQLSELIPLKILYKDSHGSGDIGRIWTEHHREFAEFISKYSPKSVLEIGGGHGRLAYEYERYDNIPWTIIEPNPSPIKETKAKFINGFFDKNFKHEKKFKTIVHSHVFEHVYNHDNFMNDVSSFMKDDGHLIFTLPNMLNMLKNKYTNCLNFEHTVFLTEPYVEYLLSKYGFEIIEKKYFRHDHSIFYSTVKTSNKKIIEISKDLYSINKKIYNDYRIFHEKLITDLNNLISESKKSIYLFGAHIFSQYLICSGLNTSNIDCLLDNDPNKQGKRLYGTSMLVKSPNCLKSVNKPLIILKAGVYNDEIKKDILDNINASAEFIE